MLSSRAARLKCAIPVLGVSTLGHTQKSRIVTCDSVFLKIEVHTFATFFLHECQVFGSYLSTQLPHAHVNVSWAAAVFTFSLQLTTLTGI